MLSVRTNRFRKRAFRRAVGHDEGGRAHAQGAQVLLFGTETPGAHSGVDAVSPDQDVRGERRSGMTSDGDADAVVVPRTRDTGAP